MKEYTKKRLGIVVGNPKVDKFSFGANKNGSVRRGQLVETSVGGLNVVGQIDEIVAVNEYFDEGATIRYHLEREDLTPYTSKTVFLAITRALAVVNGNGSINSPDLPVVPGSEVLPASRETAKKVLGFEEKGINLGVMMHNEDIQVSLDPDKLIPTHTAILAQTGGGKTYTVLIMVEEFLKKNLIVWDAVLGKKSKIHFLVIDPHGEYKKILESAKEVHKEDEVFVFSGPYTIPITEAPTNLPSFIKEIAPKITDPQFRILEEACSKIKEISGIVTMDNLENTIKKGSGAKQTKDILLQILKRFKEYKLIGNVGSIDLIKNISKKKILILDFSRASQYIQQVYLKYALKRVFDSRTDGKIPPLCIVIEEIHNFAPSIRASEASITRGTIRNIAREGRKFGVGLCIVSQRPSMIDTTVVSQCSTIIALRTTNERDLNSISAISEGMNADLLRKLPPGVALIAGRAVNYPVYAKIRHRIVKEDREGKFFEEKMIFHSDKSGQAKLFVEC